MVPSWSTTNCEETLRDPELFISGLLLVILLCSKALKVFSKFGIEVQCNTIIFGLIVVVPLSISYLSDKY